MTRQEYMEELKKYLKRLPQEDFDNAIEYFSEYFEEAGPEKEQQVMRELGEPKEAARELFLNLLQESVEKDQDIVEEKAPVLKGKRRSPGKIILLVFLVLCASPASLALLAFVFAVLCAVILTVAAVIFSIGITGIAAIAGGIVTIGVGCSVSSGCSSVSGCSVSSDCSSVSGCSVSSDSGCSVFSRFSCSPACVS